MIVRPVCFSNQNLLGIVNSLFAKKSLLCGHGTPRNKGLLISVGTASNIVDGNSSSPKGLLGERNCSDVMLLAFRIFILAKRIYRKAIWLRAGRAISSYDGDTPASLLPRHIPRIIWIFWAQGEEKAPPIVRLCIASWRQRNLGWEVRVLDSDSIAEFTPIDDIPTGIIPSHFADIVRVRLLAEHGGVWADATTYCVKPLEHWLSALMQGGFFAFYRPHPDRLISSWFLASEPGGEIVRMWNARIASYWSGRMKADDYLWLHYLFEWTVKFDSVFRAAWSKVPKISANGPHLLRRCIENGISPARLTRASVDAVPLFKLTWKSELPAAELRKWGIQLDQLATQDSSDTAPAT